MAQVSGEPLQAAAAKDWDKVVPGSAARLFDEFQLQMRHRRRIENWDKALAFLGPILGLVVVLTFLGTAAWLIRSGYRIEGTVLGSVDIVSLAAVFVVGVGNQGPARGQVTSTAEQATAEVVPGQAN